jgi:hypothetical protein
MTEKTNKERDLTISQEPYLGIFWLLDGKLFTDSAPLSQAEPYGDHLTHPRGHVHVWEEWQRIGKVSLDLPYEELPRGRVMFNVKKNEFVLLADRCILKKRSAVAEIRNVFHLPKKITLDGDPHYRCHHCLYGNVKEEDDDE